MTVNNFTPYTDGLRAQLGNVMPKELIQLTDSYLELNAEEAVLLFTKALFLPCITDKNEQRAMEKEVREFGSRVKKIDLSKAWIRVCFASYGGKIRKKYERHFQDFQKLFASALERLPNVTHIVHPAIVQVGSEQYHSKLFTIQNVLKKNGRAVQIEHAGSQVTYDTHFQFAQNLLGSATATNPIYDTMLDFSGNNPVHAYMKVHRCWKERSGGPEMIYKQAVQKPDKKMLRSSASR